LLPHKKILPAKPGLLIQYIIASRKTQQTIFYLGIHFLNLLDFGEKLYDYRKEYKLVRRGFVLFFV
jgi:hypothetical protein